jgi:hypothetical protein
MVATARTPVVPDRQRPQQLLQPVWHFPKVVALVAHDAQQVAQPPVVIASILSEVGNEGRVQRRAPVGVWSHGGGGVRLEGVEEGGVGLAVLVLNPVVRGVRVGAGERGRGSGASEDANASNQPANPLHPTRPHLSDTSTRNCSHISSLHQNGCASTDAMLGRWGGFLDSMAATMFAASGQRDSAARLQEPRIMLVSRS